MKSDSLSNAELNVISVLWDKGPSTVAEVRDAINAQTSNKREFAYTTVATHLNRMLEKGAVNSRKEGRQHIFEAAEDRSAYRENRLTKMVKQFFDNKPSSLASQFIESNSFTPEELEKLSQLIDKKRPR